jgi:hypothetical protein
MSVNFFYILIIFISSISFSIYIIIPNINRISFWIRYHIIISGITNIELNIIITDYENLSEQINLIIFFIIIRVYVPFIITYFYIKTVGIIEIQYNFHWGYFIYSFILSSVHKVPPYLQTHGSPYEPLRSTSHSRGPSGPGLRFLTSRAHFNACDLWCWDPGCADPSGRVVPAGISECLPPHPSPFFTFYAARVEGARRYSDSRAMQSSVSMLVYIETAS